MESMLTLIFYIVIFAVIIYMFVTSVKTNKWKATVITQLICFLFAVASIFVYDSLPGTGKAPGLTHFADVFYSLCAAAVYFAALIITLITRFCIKVYKNEI